MSDFVFADYAALVFFVAAWVGYKIAVEDLPIAKRSLNARMNDYRRAWKQQMLARELRIVDTTILATLQNGTAFFASTSLIAIGGALALLRSTDEVLGLVADLPFGLKTTRVAWELKVVGLVVIFGYAFFKFSWSYRLFNYAAILLGATPMASEKDTAPAQEAASRTAAMNVVAGRHFNRGQRAFFFALAYLGWFVSPYVLVISTAAVLAVMWRRQFASDARAALDA
ncbi:DUF599 family protein [Chelatococcus sp. SYSU_G07232]|uniref:DUF599 family protein n=1 Tax=Chelatococcus albus TaxID=3047466 RepID=A0ABT7ACZ5_9HYPH|nr:DUF599 family protein [Chelatococcus sp. SYSU_G07232]MDJ1157248.1 DUF599 family protein [Chelatococcus sp. SYSU_G07232]